MNRPDTDDGAVKAALDQLGYGVEAELGRGGTAIVYRAVDRKHGRPVAVKVVRAAVADEIELERFARELRLAAQLVHPHILPVHDSGVAAGLPFYVTPLVEDRTLRDRLHHGPLPVPEAVRVAIDIAEALAFAHEHGVIHRDIKPENVLLSDGHAVLADFGIAKAIDAAARRRRAGRPDDRRLTGAGMVIGTPDYMSPEQSSGDAVDERTDIFALGCVLFEMLTGDVPFGGATFEQMLAKRLNVTRERIVDGLPGVPGPLAEVVARCVAASPDDRYPSARAVAEALEAAASVAAVRWPIPRRTRRLVAAGVAIAAGLILTGLILTSASRDSPRRVVVLPLTNETRQPALDPLAQLAADRMVTALGGLDGVEVVTSAVDVPSFRIARHGPATTPAADQLERLHAAAAEADAGTIVSGSYYAVQDSLELIVEVTDARSGRLLHAIGPLHGPAGKADSLAGALATAVADAVGSALGAHRSAGRPPGG